MRGTLPSELNLLTRLKRFLAPENFLRGTIQGAFQGLSTLETLVMPINRLYGTIPMQLVEKNPNLTHFDVSDNNLVGQIPPFAGGTALTDLQLRDNALTG